jgi:hypothetical protein
MMDDARSHVQELEALVLSRQIDMVWSPGLMATPPHKAITSIDERRIRGMLVGLAIGDLLGNKTEGLLPRERRTKHGEIRDYLHQDDNGKCVGLPSDDTQVAFLTLEHLLNQGRIVPAKLADDFASQEIFGVGKSTQKFVRGIKEGSFNVLPRKRSKEVCGRFRPGRSKKKKSKGGGRYE